MVSTSGLQHIASANWSGGRHLQAVRKNPVHEVRVFVCVMQTVALLGGTIER